MELRGKAGKVSLLYKEKCCSIRHCLFQVGVFTPSGVLALPVPFVAVSVKSSIGESTAYRHGAKPGHWREPRVGLGSVRSPPVPMMSGDEVLWNVCACDQIQAGRGSTLHAPSRPSLKLVGQSTP